ncbi:hypothetical protein CF326_g970 [Tilletia indica]|nr:hypothetical protein CF326_g970 [Tilletia indica]
MLGSPERRLFIVRTVRLCTILSCILFFGGVVTQLKSDTHQATRPTCDDQPSVPLPKRYLPTLIVSRIFLLFLILVVFLAHFPLSDRARSVLSKLSFPLQGSAWAQTDMTVGEQGKRSEQLDADLQGDVSKLIGSAIILLFASAQELSRRITQYLLVAAFLIASVGLLNLIAAILLYNPAYSGPFAYSKSTSLQHDDNSALKSVLRERPSAPSYLHALSTSTASAMKSFGKVGLAPQPDTALHPARLHAGTYPASRTIGRVPVPTAMEEAHLRQTPPQTPPPIIQVTSPSPSGSHLNPLSPQLAHSSNGRHPLATDEALRLELHQPLAATVGVAVTGDEAKTTPVNNQRIRGESDKDALIRMWTAQIAEQRRNDFESPATSTNLPVHAPTPALLPNTGAGGGTIPAPQEPRLGGRMEITAPYLSLREARALYAQRKAAAAVATAAAAAVSGPTTTSHVAAPTTSRQAGDQHSTVPNEKPSAFVKTEEQGNEDRGHDTDDDAKMGNVSGLYVSRLHSAPKFQSMQGVLALRRSSVPSLSHTAQTSKEAHHNKEPESARRFSSSSRKRSPSSVSISISVSSSGDDRRAVAPRKGRRPPSLTFESCSRPESSTAPPSTCPSSPEGPPRSETTRWSRTSAGYTVRTGITGTGTGTVASGFKHAALRLRGGERSDDLPERESKYLSAVLAAIRGPSPTTEQDHHLRPPSFVPPPMPPIPLSPGDSSPRTHPPVSPLRSPGMVSELQSAQKAALARAKERNKLRSLWLTRPVTTTSPR